MSPEYLLYFRASRPRSLDELRLIGRELERVVTCIEEYNGARPLTYRNALEKDLVYDPGRGKSEIGEIRESGKRKIECFNCGGDHFLRDCSEPWILKCYGCGKVGVIRPECDCSKKGVQKTGVETIFREAIGSLCRR